MGLWERWTADDETKITVHDFVSFLREFARGQVTRAQVIAVFDLAGDDVTELDAIANHYQGLPNQAAKDRYIVLLDDVQTLSESEKTRPIFTRAHAASRLGF